MHLGKRAPVRLGVNGRAMKISPFCEVELTWFASRR